MNESLTRAEAHLPQILELLADLAAIDTGTGHVKGIERAGEIIAHACAGLGFTVEFAPAGDYGRHLVARREGRGRPLLAIGHLDTVHPPGTARRPSREGDAFIGPGVCDCKGGICLFLLAATIWRDGGWPDYPLTLIVNADEEVGSPSSRPLIEAEAARARAALLVEPAPGLNAAITARKGIGRYILRVFGRSAHAGSDREAGINALVELAAKILALERLNEDGGGYAVTVGTAAGGIRPNVIPDYAQAEIDLRISLPDQVGRAGEAIERAAAVSTVPGARYRLEGGITRPPMPDNEANRRLFERARLIAGELGLDLAPAASGGGSDANFCAALGVPTLDGLGPVGTGAHTGHERISLSSMPVRAALLAELGRRLADF